jgi:transposase
MDTLHRCCAGLDVHKETVVACVRRVSRDGRVTKEVRTFSTMTRELLRLGDWLEEQHVSHVAMESTGVYWKPVYNLLEDRFEVLLVNAQHIKKVPGRKTDVKDCEWIAELLQHGLLRGSFIPDRPIRELRDLTRQRTQLIRQRASVVNRVHKVLEDANIKLTSVATDVMGVSCQQMLEALLAGETDVAKMADLAQRRMRSKIPQLQLALEGRLTDHHRFLLRMHLDHILGLEALMGRLTERIEELMVPFAWAEELLDTIPGINQETAQTLVAELGANMTQWPSARHLASWAGLCPGNNESAGKRRTGKTTKGSRWLRRVLVQAAWAAARTKETYLRTHYWRLCKRRGEKRALIGVAHTILVMIYHMLSRRVSFHELGPNYLDHQHQDRLVKQLVKRLQNLGHHVLLTPVPAA